MKVTENSTGVTLHLGHPMFPGGSSEDVELRVTDATTSLVQTCVVHIESTTTSAASEEPTLARGAGSVAAASIGAAGAASTLSLLSTTTCGSEEKLPFILHPTGISVNGNRYFGVIVGNLAIAAGVTLLSYVLVCFVFKCAPGCLPFQELLAAKGLTRFPSVALFIFLTLYQGTSYASLRLVASHNTTGELLCGLVSVVFCIMVPAVTAREVKRSVPSKAVYRLEKGSPRYKTFMLGAGEWIAVSRSDLWHQRYRAMVKPYKERTAWFAVFSFLLAFAVGALNVPEVDSMVQCGHLKLGIGVLFAVIVAFIAVLCPYARWRDNIALIVLNGMTSSALFLQAFGFYSENLNDWRFLTAGTLFQGCMVLIIVKGITDLACDLFVLLTNRRSKLQEEIWPDEVKASFEAELVDMEELGLQEGLPHNKDFEESISSISLSSGSGSRGGGGGGGGGGGSPVEWKRRSDVCGLGTSLISDADRRDRSMFSAGRSKVVGHGSHSSQSAEVGGLSPTMLSASQLSRFPPRSLTRSKESSHDSSLSRIHNALGGGGGGGRTSFYSSRSGGEVVTL